MCTLRIKLEKCKRFINFGIIQYKIDFNAFLVISERHLMIFQVSLGVFATYAKSLGVPYAVMVLLLFGFYQVASVFSNVWLSKWTSDATLTNRTIGPPNSTIYRDKNDYYLGIYGGAGALQGISLSRHILLSWGSSRCFLSRHIWWSFFQIQVRLSKFLEIVLLFFLFYIFFSFYLFMSRMSTRPKPQSCQTLYTLS